MIVTRHNLAKMLIETRLSMAEGQNSAITMPLKPMVLP